METELPQLLGLSEAVVKAVLEKTHGDADAQQFLDRVRERLADNAGDADVEQLKAQLKYDNTRLEQEVHRLTKQIGQLRSTAAGAETETKTVREELQATKAQLDEATRNLQDQRELVESRAHSETQLREQADQLRDEKRALLSQIAERRDELDGKAKEIDRLSEVIHDLQQARETEKEELAKLRSQTSVSDVNEHMLKQSLDLAKNQVKWLDDELTTTQAQMQQARSELARLSATSKAEAEQLRADIEALTEQTAELRERNTIAERTLRGKLESERAAKEELIEQTEQFKREMTAQKKLCSEWEKTAEASKQHVRSVEQSLQELEDHQRETEEKANQAVAMMEQRVDELETAYDNAQEQIQKLTGELETANALLDR
ncbi:hypothetical protein EC988_005105, partial [Linderina pennispora]